MNRRAFCRRAAGAAIGAGLAASTGASAQDPVSTASDSDPVHEGVVSTRGHFDIDIEWWNVAEGFQDESLLDCHTPYDYDATSLPGVAVRSDPDCARPTLHPTGSEPDELVVMTHGFLNSADYARTIFDQTATALSKNGYDSPVVGFSWDSDLGGPLTWWDTEDVADRNGTKLAAFLTDYRDATDATEIRLIGHSLGARVVLSTLVALHKAGRGERIRSLALLGAAVPRVAVTEGSGSFADSVAAVPDRVTSYYDTNDDTLGSAYALAELVDLESPEALGRLGSKGLTPDTFDEVDVTDDVADHTDYFEPGNCMDEVVRRWNRSAGD